MTTTIARSYVVTDHGQLHLRTAGTGGPLPTLLMLHQVPNSGQIFEPVIPLLAEDRRVIAADIPGFGMSDPLPDPQTIEGYAEVIGKALRDVVPGPMDIVGYHTGAMLAAVLTARHPQAVRNLVLISMPLFDTQRRSTLRTTAPIAADGAHLSNEWQSTMSVRPDGQSIELAARLVAEKQRAGSKAAFAMAAIAAFDAEPTLHSIRVPTTLVRPHDGLWDNTAAAAKIIPGARLVDAPSWTYGFFDADPKGVAELIIESLQDRP